MRISDWSSDVCSSDLREERCFDKLSTNGVRMSASIPPHQHPTLHHGVDAFELAHVGQRVAVDRDGVENGREARRERGCQYAEITRGAGYQKKKKTQHANGRRRDNKQNKTVQII